MDTLESRDHRKERVSVTLANRPQCCILNAGAPLTFMTQLVVAGSRAGADGGANGEATSSESRGARSGSNPGGTATAR